MRNVNRHRALEANIYMDFLGLEMRIPTTREFFLISTYR